MTRRPLVLAGLAAVAAVAVWIAWPDASPQRLDASSPATPPAAEVAREAADAVPEPASPPTDDAAGQRTEVERVGQDADLATAPAPIDAAYDGDDATVIRVVDPQGAPVPGSDVYLLDPKDQQETEELELAFNDGELDLHAIVRRFGTHYRTGEDGTVRVPPLNEMPLLLAEHEDHAAFGFQFEQDVSPIELVLEPRQTLTVRVVDPAGRSVPEAPIALQTRFGSNVHRLFTRRADDQGMLVLSDLETFLENAIGGGALELVPGHVASPGQPESEPLTLDDELLAAASCTLVLPDTGSVEVQVIDEAGEAYTGEGRMVLEAVTDGPRDRELAAGAQAELIDGSARFEHVGLHGEFQATFRRRNAAVSDELTLLGPTAPGETVTAQLVRHSRPTLTGRLLAPDGEPVREAGVQLSLQAAAAAPWEGLSQSFTQTDAEGRFTWEVDSEPLEDLAGPLTLQVRQPEDEDRAPRTTECQVDAALQPGLHSLGDLMLTESPVLAQGRVVQGDGTPVPHARLSVDWEVPESERHRSGHWHARRHLQARSADDGSFTIWGEVPAGSGFFLEVNAQDHLETQHPFAPPATGLEIRLASPSLLIGSILLPPGAPLSELDVMVVHRGEDGDEERDGLSTQHHPSEHRIEFRAPIESEALLRLEITDSAGHPVHTIEPLVMTPGGETRPPTLQPLDLRNRLRLVTVTVLDPAGDAADARVGILRPTGNRHIRNTREGAVTLLLARPAEEIIVTASGHGVTVLEDLFEDREVRLAAGVEIELRAPAQFAAHPDFELGVHLFPAERDRQMLGLGVDRASFSEDGRAQVGLPAPGRYQAFLSLSKRGPDTWNMSMLRQEQRLIEVTADGEVHRLDIDPEAFQKTVEKLRDGE